MKRNCFMELLRHSRKKCINQSMDLTFNFQNLRIVGVQVCISESLKQQSFWNDTPI